MSSRHLLIAKDVSNKVYSLSSEWARAKLCILANETDRIVVTSLWLISTFGEIIWKKNGCVDVSTNQVQMNNCLNVCFNDNSMSGA